VNKITRSEKKEPKKFILKQHNNFIQAKYSLSLIEKKLLLGVAWIYQNAKSSLFFENDHVVITAKDISAVMNIPKGSWQLFDKALENLQSTLIEIKEPDKNEMVRFSFFSKAHYKDGVCYLYFVDEMSNFFEDIVKNYTLVDLHNIKELKSFSSIRLYELLKQYENTSSHKRYFKLEELREYLGLADTEYREYKYFKQHILKKADKEFRENTDLYFTIEEHKVRKTVAAITFYIHKNVDHAEKVVKTKENFIRYVIENKLTGMDDRNLRSYLEAVEFEVQDDKVIIRSPNSKNFQEMLQKACDMFFTDPIEYQTIL